MWETLGTAGCCGSALHSYLWITWLHMWTAAWALRLSTANPPTRPRLSAVYPQVTHMTCAT